MFQSSFCSSGIYYSFRVHCTVYIPRNFCTAYFEFCEFSSTSEKLCLIKSILISDECILIRVSASDFARVKVENYPTGIFYRDKKVFFMLLQTLIYFCAISSRSVQYIFREREINIHTYSGQHINLPLTVKFI